MMKHIKVAIIMLLGLLLASVGLRYYYLEDARARADKMADQEDFVEVFKQSVLSNSGKPIATGSLYGRCSIFILEYEGYIKKEVKGDGYLVETVDSSELKKEETTLSPNQWRIVFDAHDFTPFLIHSDLLVEQGVPMLLQKGVIAESGLPSGEYRSYRKTRLGRLLKIAALKRLDCDVLQ